MKISFWEKLTGLPDKDLNQGGIDNSEESDEQEEKFFEELEKVSLEEPSVLSSSLLKTPEDGKELEKNTETEEGLLTIDIYQTPEEIIVRSTIAGAKKKDLEIIVEKDTLTIRGERKHGEIRSIEYLHQECFWGKFSRSVILPQKIKEEEMKSSLKNGILTIVLPKAKSLIEKKNKKR